MNRESYLETVKKQFTDEIHSAYIHCQHEGPNNSRLLDISALESKLQKLKRVAVAEGISENDFDDLIHAAIPESQVSANIKKAA